MSDHSSLPPALYFATRDLDVLLVKALGLFNATSGVAAEIDKLETADMVAMTRLLRSLSVTHRRCRAVLARFDEPEA